MTMEEKSTLHERAKLGREEVAVLLHHGGTLETFGEDAKLASGDPDMDYAKFALDELNKVRLRILDNGWKRVYLVIKEY